jgi:UDP-hydrolysing UDP-N-acetyl-D-glucosamine 2-epimerase
MIVGVVTSTRADYGLLRPVMRLLQASSWADLRVIATGTHLTREFGHTIDAIAADGFEVDDRVDMLLASDTPVGVTKSMGLATIGFADSYQRLRPDILLLLGDRYEILAAAQAALIAKIPVAHLCGGDVTEGALDDAIRHAITKLSHLHFVTNELAAQRVRQMGEDPQRVHVVGNPGLDDLVPFVPLDRPQLEGQLGMSLQERNLLVTYHPATLASEPPAVAFAELLAALDSLGPNVGIVITMPNADTGGRVLLEMVREFTDKRDHAVSHASLGQVRYWSCLKTFDLVLGNSSSGLMEAPVVGTPAVNVGRRQDGRLRAPTTIDCQPERGAIRTAIERGLAWHDAPRSSPYGDGHAGPRIVDHLSRLEDPSRMLVKRFRLV